MNSFRTFWRRIRPLGQKRVAKREIDEELRFHLEQRTAENVAAGMSPEDAARAARKEFGNLQNVREECRDARGASFGETLWQDLQFAARMLRKNPGFTSVVVLTLALGIGASTAIYSLVNTVILNPLPGAQADRLMQIAEHDYDTHNHQPRFVGVSPPVVEGLHANQAFFSDFGWYNGGANLERKTEDFVARANVELVSPNFFTFWNVPPLLGRTFARDEAVPLNESQQPKQDAVIVISHAFWKNVFDGAPDAIGKAIEMSGRHYTVIGVMPPHFRFPSGYTEVWMAAEDPGAPPRTTSVTQNRVLVRLKPGVSEAQARAMLETLAARLMKDQEGRSYGRIWDRQPEKLAFWIRPLREEFTGAYGMEDLRRTLFGLLGGIGFVLLIVCVNIANLMLARTERRQQEMAVRAALGAGRARLMRQLLTESVLLASLGGLAGLAVAFWGLKLLSSLVPQGMAGLKVVRVDGQMLGVTLLISILTGLAFGLAPAWHASRARLNETLKLSGASASPGVGRRRYRGALVITEVALALVLLAGAGLMIESVVRLLHVKPGFDPENLLRVLVQLPWTKYNDPEHTEPVNKLRNTILAGLQERFSALPGVTAVGIYKYDSGGRYMYATDGQAEPVEVTHAGCGVGESDPFRAMRISLLAGRYFEKGDIGDKMNTVIVNEALARLCWPGENAVGKRLRERVWRGEAPVWEVVGVVADVRLNLYDVAPKPTYFRPYQDYGLEGTAPIFMLRTQRDPRPLISAVRKELKAADPAMGTPGITVASQALYDATLARRVYMNYLIAFAGVGLLLAVVGIYGVLAYSVARRTREIGIRMAVGAERSHVLFMVMKEGTRLIVAGLAIGLLAAFGLTRLLRSQLFEVHPSDPMALGGATLLLFVVALVACYLPARRATRINPMTALRYE
jgi:predicted permease